MAFWAYMLRCNDGKYYTGHKDNLEQRIAQHHFGGYCDFTSRRRPVELVWTQEFQTRDDAFQVEFIIKGWSRAKKEGLIAGNWQQVSFFARPPHKRVSTALDTSGLLTDRVSL